MNKLRTAALAASLAFTNVASAQSPVKIELIPPTTFHANYEGKAELDALGLRTIFKKLFHIDAMPVAVHYPQGFAERIERGIPNSQPPVWERFRIQFSFHKNQKPDPGPEKPLPGLIDRTTGKPVEHKSEPEQKPEEQPVVQP